MVAGVERLARRLARICVVVVQMWLSAIKIRDLEIVNDVKRKASSGKQKSSDPSRPARPPRDTDLPESPKKIAENHSGTVVPLLDSSPQSR